MVNVEFAKDEDKLVCFVNSLTPPDRVERLSIYRYVKDIDDKPVFYELCKYKYIHEEMIEYTVLTWEVISVPKYKEANFLLICDAMKSLNS